MKYLTFCLLNILVGTLLYYSDQLDLAILRRKKDAITTLFRGGAYNSGRRLGSDIQGTSSTRTRGEIMTVDTSAIREAVTLEGVRAHISALQSIAEANGDTRSSGTRGYDVARDYVRLMLETSGYYVTTQSFDFNYWREKQVPKLELTGPKKKRYSVGVENGFYPLEFSGSGNVTAVVQAVDLTLVVPGRAERPNKSTSGCEEGDFETFQRGNIALIQRGSCSFRQKVDNAQNAGASGVIIFNEGQERRTEALYSSLGGPGVNIPVLFSSHDVGIELATAEDSSITMVVDAKTSVHRTSNTIAETPAGREDSVIVVSAHLDSVLNGPGINDNGSGASAVLEVALQLARLNVEPMNKVRFVFFGAEEFGLAGSSHYVNHLEEHDLDSIALSLNFDMISSPNFFRGVQSGGAPDLPRFPDAAGVIEEVFTTYYDSEGLESEVFTNFLGMTDGFPFIERGIPTGGIFTGHNAKKTEEQAKRYGGKAGESFDPCYHLPCDTIENINEEALDQNSDAIAHAVMTFAISDLAVMLGETRIHKTDSKKELEALYGRIRS